MLIFDNHTSSYEVDPHYLNIRPLLKIWAKDTHPTKGAAKAKLMWLYHMYNPHSPFRDYKNSTKSIEIVKATFPPFLLKEKEAALQKLIDEAKSKNRDIEEENKKIQDPKMDKKELEHVAKLKIYDPEYDEEMEEAISWYRDYHLKQTSLWDAYDAYKEAMYNLSSLIRNPKSSASDIRTASQELDTIPLKMERMRQQAVKDEAQILKTSGDKNIRRSERLPQDKRQSQAIR